MLDKKIVFIHHGKVIGGAPRSLKNTIIGLEKEGFNNMKILCAYQDMKSFFQDSTKVEVGGIYSPYLTIGRVFVGLASLTRLYTMILFMLEFIKFPYIIFRQFRQLYKEKPDIVHLNSSILFLPAVSVKLLKIPLVWHVREVLIGGKWSLRKKFTGWFIRKLADEVICISEVEAQSLGNDEYKNINVIYNFIDFSLFSDKNINIEFEKKRYGLKDEKVYVSLGGVSFRKGTIEIIQTAKIMKNDKFLIAGTYPTKNDYFLLNLKWIKLVHNIEDFLMRNNLKTIYSWYYTQRVEFLYFDSPITNLKFVGKLDDVVPLIAISDALIFAGCTPHFPRPVYEAWAMKKPVVVFNMEGIIDNVDNGIDGVICENNTADGICSAISKVNDKMGMNGYEKAVERFNMDINIKKIIDIYREIV